MIGRCSTYIVVSLLLFTTVANAKGIREHTRLKNTTLVSPEQAHELTLTLVTIEKQLIQTWVRAAANINKDRNTLYSSICSAQKKLLHVGQRVRAFTANSKSSIYQAKIIRLLEDKGCLQVTSKISRKTFGISKQYVIEVIVSRGKRLALPNEAIIEEEGKQFVYIQKHGRHYVPKTIRTGIQGELYTEILDGLKKGDLAVTFGSFFIDVEYKLQNMRAGHAHQHH